MHLNRYQSGDRFYSTLTLRALLIIAERRHLPTPKCAAFGPCFAVFEQKIVICQTTRVPPMLCSYTGVHLWFRCHSVPSYKLKKMVLQIPSEENLSLQPSCTKALTFHKPLSCIIKFILIIYQLLNGALLLLIYCTRTYLPLIFRCLQRISLK